MRNFIRNHEGLILVTGVVVALFVTVAMITIEIIHPGF